VSLLGEMALPPCHCLFQFYVAENKISCQLYQRSADIFLGVPFNIASYSLLLHLIAEQTGYEVGDFIWTGGDCHLYLNHIDQAKIQLQREPLNLPEIAIKKNINSIFDYKFEDIEFINYEAHEKILAPISV
jgi:thymidylate synthase